MSSKIKHFPSANFLSFEINTADILGYEHDHYHVEAFEEYHELYDYLKFFLINVNFEAFLTPDMVKSGKYGQHYYDNYLYDRRRKEN